MRADSRGGIPESGVSNPDGSTSTSDDPRVAAGLDEYLAELQAGRRPSRQDFLARHPEIVDALDRGLDVLDFLHSAAGATEPRSPNPADGEAPPPETILGDYRLIREVGRGGMGVVYEAEQISLGRRVAVKVLSGAGVLDPRRLQRFRIEAQAVAQLNHAHIVPIFAVGSDRGIHYFAMQYIEGCTLAEILENHPARRREVTETPTLPPSGQTPPDRPQPAAAAPSSVQAQATPHTSRETFRAIAELGIQAAEALDHAHAMGVLHRDIKPSNLLIDSRGGLWIADFGLARFRDDSGLTVTGDLVGTLRYMAPEMAMGRRTSFDPRSDIYALGATLYELATLRPVFDGKDRRELLRQITQDEPTPPRRIDPAIPGDLATIVMKAMGKEPEHRYDTAGLMADDLRRFLDHRPIRARPPSPWERLSRWAHRYRAVLMAAASVALVALGIGSEMVWAERRLTAEEKKHRMQVLETLGEGAGVLSKGVGLLALSDTLTMKGMEQFARTAGSRPDPATQQFYQWALEFYERLTRERSIDRRTQALAFRRLAFTRMVSTNDSRAEGDFRRSIEIYESLLSGEPRDPDLRDGLADACYYFGLFQYARGRMALAGPSFRKAIAIVEERAFEAPTEPQLLELLASHRVNVGTWESQDGLEDQAARQRRALMVAFDRLTKPAAATLPSKDQNTHWAAEAYRSLARMMDGRGWLREQEDALRRGLAFEPRHPGLLLDLANFLAFRRDADRETLDEAVKFATEASEIEPARPEYWRVLALAHLHKHEIQLATRAVEKSLQLQPAEGQASDRLVMAMVLWHQGRREDARSWYVRALDRMARKPENDADTEKYLLEAMDVLKPILLAEHLTVNPTP
jgi:serine/threonine protein kinase/tetratricopeptide (TPR) repeat protein